MNMNEIVNAKIKIAEVYYKLSAAETEAKKFSKYYKQKADSILQSAKKDLKEAGYEMG